MKPKYKLYLLAMLPFLLLIVFYEILPIVMIVVRSFQPVGGIGFTLEHYQAIFTKRLYQQSIVNSIQIAVISSVIGIIIAFFAAKAVHDVDAKWRNGFINILTMTSNFAGIPLASAMLVCWYCSGRCMAYRLWQDLMCIPIRVYC